MVTLWFTFEEQALSKKLSTILHSTCNLFLFPVLLAPIKKKRQQQQQQSIFAAICKQRQDLIKVVLKASILS